MAKKKRKKKWSPPARPVPPEHRESRAAKKETARIERERQIRRMRRRIIVRRAATYSVVTALIGGIVGFVLVRNSQEDERLRQLEAIAAEIGCGPVEEPEDEGRQHVETPPTYRTVPATSGPHASSQLPTEPRVFEQPFDPALEFRAVHNLEHGYVLVYYRQDGNGALEKRYVDALAERVEGEAEVIMAPHPNLPQGTNLALVAWTRLQTCRVRNVDVDNVELVVRGFIDVFRNADSAPEAARA